MTDLSIPTPPDPRDLRIESDHAADTTTLARLAPSSSYTRRAAAGLLCDLAPHVVGHLSAVSRAGAVVPMREEIEAVTAIRKAGAR